MDKTACIMETERLIKNHALEINGDGIAIVGASGKTLYREGDTYQGYKVLFCGVCASRPTAILEKIRADGVSAVLIQKSGDGEYFSLPLSLYEPEDRSSHGKDLYLGMEKEEILNSGRDILAEKLLAKGEPSYGQVKNILPPITKKAFSFISGVSSWNGLIIWSNGDICAQPSGDNREPAPLFSPSEIDAEMGGVTPSQCRVEGWMPIHALKFTKNGRVMRLTYFVSPDDPDRDPAVWIRSVRYEEDKPNERFFMVSAAGLADVWPEKKAEITPEKYWTGFAAAALYWQNFERDMAEFALPEEKLNKAVKGMMSSLAITFSADHAHYGHRGYGYNLHDNFPPNYINAAEVYLLFGFFDKARRLIEHVLAYCVDAFGRFSYYGPSASEYGQWFYTVEKAEGALKPEAWLKPYAKTLARMGRYLASTREVISPDGEKGLIRMGAEADTRFRVNVYVSNNLWAVRGFESLSRLLSKYGCTNEAAYFEHEAKDLYKKIRLALDENAVISKYGVLVPFQLGYSAVPLNLSACRKTSVPVSEETLEKYLDKGYPSGGIEGKQDLSENTYANYRYYLEMLSSALLKPEEENAIVNMREALGGELLCMTRLYGWLDDWPAANYARYLLTSDRIDKYLLSMYAHTAHHGNPELGVYYEQVSIDGRVVADDCTPGLLLVPAMTAWMFCFEPLSENAIYINRGVPGAWFSGDRAFGVRGLGCSLGKVDIAVNPGKEYVTVDIALPEGYDGRPVYVDIRGRGGFCLADISEGRELADSVTDGLRIKLKDSLHREIHLKISIPPRIIA